MTPATQLFSCSTCSVLLFFGNYQCAPGAEASGSSSVIPSRSGSPGRFPCVLAPELSLRMVSSVAEPVLGNAISRDGIALWRFEIAVSRYPIVVGRFAIVVKRDRIALERDGIAVWRDWIAAKRLAIAI